MKNSKVHKTLNLFIRSIIVVLSLGFIYWKVFATGKAGELVDSLHRFISNDGFYSGIGLLTLLMILNWSIESIKWQGLVNRIERVSFLKSLQSVLTGVTVSIFTPNRTGEFIGRAFILRNSNPLTAVILTIIGSFSQLLITILLGSIGLVVAFIYFLPAIYAVPEWAKAGIYSGILLLDFVILIMYFNIPPIIAYLDQRFNKRFGRWTKILQPTSEMPRKELIRLLILSLFRYLVFSAQFFIVLQLFGISLPYATAAFLIPVIFLTLAIIPTFALSELGVRGSVSLFFIGMFFEQSRGAAASEAESMGIVLAAGMLWFINLALPAIIGVPFVFKLRFFRKYQE